MMDTLMDRCVAGDILPESIEDAILDAVDEWHNSKGTLPLDRYLGLTWDEYGRWIKGIDLFEDIVKERKG